MTDLESKLQKIADAGGDPWAAMSMGGGRKLEPQFNTEGQMTSGTSFNGCPNSPDGYHHYTAVSCVQSIEHFVCDYCPDNWYD